jgi:hypothetical protein
METMPTISSVSTVSTSGGTRKQPSSCNVALHYTGLSR